MLTKDQITELFHGSLSDELKLEYLARLSTDDSRNQGTFQAVTESVRACLAPQAAGLFTPQDLTDCCGTGGSGISHFNTSTTVAFVLAAAGLKTAKFGNRSASSQSGSFDLLDKLGIGATLPLDALPELLEQCDLTFLFAPQFYPALTSIAPLRKALGRPTVLNFIGPLLNPAEPSYRLIGVPRRDAQILVAMSLQAGGTVKQALVVNAHWGLDELDGQCASTTIRISGKRDVQYGVLEAQSDWSAAGKIDRPLTVEDNLAIFKALLDAELGKDNYYHNLVTLNAGAAMHIAGRTSTLAEGRELAAHLLKTGQVKEKFLQYKTLHNKQKTCTPN